MGHTTDILHTHYVTEAASAWLALLLSYCGAASPPPPPQGPMQLTLFAVVEPQSLLRPNLTRSPDLPPLRSPSPPPSLPPPQRNLMMCPLRHPPPTTAEPQLTLFGVVAPQSLLHSNLTWSPHLPAEVPWSNRTTRPPSPPSPHVEPADPGLLMTRAVYVAGHSVPHPELCPALGERLRLMIVVASAPKHVEARTAVRLTWGHFAMRTDVSLAFLVGTTRDADAQAALAAEDKIYGDVVRANFVDSYSNLTLKTISMLEWAVIYCPRARRLLKTDDDMFVNVLRLLAFSKHHAADTRTIYGYKARKWLTHRNTASEYYVPPLQYPGQVLPDFTTGSSYMLTGDCVRPLYERTLSQSYLRLEDVYVTGVIATQLNINRVHSVEFSINWRASLDACDVRGGISIHKVGYYQQFELWRKLFGVDIKCAETAPNQFSVYNG